MGLGTHAGEARRSAVGARPNRCVEERPIFFVPEKPADRQTVLYSPHCVRKGPKI